jgi:plasmid stability protein
MPDGMRDRIKIEAEKNNRSMNAEIIALLEQAYPETSVMDRLLSHQQNLFRAWEKETDGQKKAAIAEELIAVKDRVDKELEVHAFSFYLDAKADMKNSE